MCVSVATLYLLCSSLVHTALLSQSPPAAFFFAAVHAALTQRDGFAGDGMREDNREVDGFSARSLTPYFLRCLRDTGFMRAMMTRR